jgi:hypothetical protein
MLGAVAQKIGVAKNDARSFAALAPVSLKCADSLAKDAKICSRPRRGVK